MYRLKYKLDDIFALLEESIKLRPSRLKQVHLPSVFQTEEYDILRHCKVNTTMADHLISRGQTHTRKLHDHLRQLGGVVLPQYVVFLATYSSIEWLLCLGGVVVLLDYSRVYIDPQQY